MFKKILYVPPIIKVLKKKNFILFLYTKNKELAITVRLPSNIHLTKKDTLLIFSFEKTCDKKNFSWFIFLKNLFKGVSNPFFARLLLRGVGFKSVQNEESIEMKLGYSHNIFFKPSPLVSISTHRGVIMDLRSPLKDYLGTKASIIQHYRRPDVYKNKGVIYKGETLIKKIGKKA